MKCHYKLKLPSQLLNESTKHKILTIETSDNEYLKKLPEIPTFNDPAIIKEVLSQEFLLTLASLNLTPSLIHVFYRNKDVPIDKSYIHKDNILVNGEWVTIPFGINFEVNPTTVVTTTWWDTTDRQEYIDDNDYTRERKKLLNGIRYHEDFFRSSPKYLKLNPIDSVTIEGNSTPILFRADAAHSVAATTKEGPRFNVSVRFDLSQIQTFEQAVERLQPIIIND
jgi:hypothetical protein